MLLDGILTPFLPLLCLFTTGMTLGTDESVAAGYEKALQVSFYSF